MKENLVMIKKMVKGYIHLLMDKYKMDIGRMMNFKVLKQKSKNKKPII